jgi:prepilin-type N-terminal cleavage/methylation domain-containing protein
MSARRQKRRQRGFSLVELMAALGIFLVITGAAFTLLTSSQQRYQTDAQLLNSFQEARLALDQMVRDIDDSGYPPPSFAGTDTTKYAGTPFAWSTSAGYNTNPPPTPCLIGSLTSSSGTCTTSTGGYAPGDFDIIIETEPSPKDCPPNCVQWIRYQLQGTTLMRGVVNKVSGADPDGTTLTALVPFVQYVVNNSPGLQIGNFLLSTSNPGTFPGGSSVPIFSYTCDTPTTPQPPPTLCVNAITDNSPANVRDVAITLIVAAPLPDATTGMPRLVQLSGRGRRVNPNQ